MSTSLPVSLTCLCTALALFPMAAGAAPWPFTKGVPESSEAQRILIIGVGGSQVARVANCLARFGIVPDTFAVPMVPFIPETSEELSAWEAIVTGPLPGGAKRFASRQAEALGAYVRGGGGIVFVGGMDSFSGAGGSAGFDATPLADVMPVVLRPGNDHHFLRETPQAVASHPLLKGLPAGWPPIGERNRHPARPDAQVLVRLAEDPLLVVRDIGEGRSVALLTACTGRPSTSPRSGTASRGCG